MFGWILNWMEYNRGLFKTNIGQLGLSEILLLISLIHVVTGLAGQEIWDVTLTQILPEKLGFYLWKVG